MAAARLPPSLIARTRFVFHTFHKTFDDLVKHRNWKPPESYRSVELRELIERMKENDGDALEEAVAFASKESFGLWHGRARAKICRNLKNREIPRHLQDILVQAVSHRLLTGEFSEQFKDQLAMAIRFRPHEMAQYATEACESRKDYVQRYGHWVLEKLSRIPPQGENAN
jgi:hypothetical protein